MSLKIDTYPFVEDYLLLQKWQYSFYGIEDAPQRFTAYEGISRDSWKDHNII